MKESGPSPAINADKVRDYKKRVSDILAVSEKPEISSKFGEDTVRVRATGAYANPYLVTEILTPAGANPIGEPLIEVRSYLTTKAEEDEELKYTFNVQTTDYRNRAIAMPYVKNTLSPEETSAEEKNFGLHTVTEAEYEALTQKLEALKPEGKAA